MVGKDLKFKLVLEADSKTFIANIKQSESAAKEALESIKSGTASFSLETDKATKASSAFGNQAKETAQQVDQLEKQVNETNEELKETRSVTDQARIGVDGLKTGYNALASALTALGIGASAKEIAATADEYKNLSGRLTVAIGEHGNLQKAMDDVKNVAIATSANLVATGDLYARLTKIGQEMKWPQEQALALTKTINEAVSVAGGSAASNEAAITQLNQALVSGVLRGEEFNSIMEQSPRLAQALADGLGVTTGKLREMAGEGKLTTEVVTKAILSQSEQINEEFNKFPATIGAAIENLKTSWTVYIGEADAATEASTKVAGALKFVSENLDTLVGVLTTAAQAFVVYKSLGMAAVLLEKANSAKVASVAITQETTAVIANTQAQIANANTSKAAALAKSQLTTATNANTVANTASTTSLGRVSTAASGLKSNLVVLLSRLGAYGAAAAGVVVASDLIVDGFKKTDQWLQKQSVDFVDWVISRTTGTKSLADQERDFIKAEEESRKKQEASAEAKRKNTELTNALKNASLGLNEVSKATIAEFDKQVKAGAEVSKALNEVAESFNFDTTTGISNGITALLALQEQGKASSEEIRKALTGILKGEDLVEFQGKLAAIPINIEKQLDEVNNKIKAKELELEEWKRNNQNASMKDFLAANEKYKTEIEALKTEASTLHAQYANIAKSSAMVHTSILDAAILQTGLSYEQLSGKSSEAFTSAINAVKTLEKNLNELAISGVDTGAALTASLINAINTTQTRIELDYAKNKLIELEKQGLITGEQVALGLTKIEEKAKQLPAALNPVQAAFAALGIQTKDQLNDAAESAKRNFNVVSNSGQATADAIKQAYTVMLNAVAATGNKAEIAAVQAEAAAHGLRAEIDETGKTSVTSMNEVEKAVDRVGRSFGGLQGYARETGKVMREEAKSSTEAWNDMLSAMSGTMHKTPTGSRAKMAYDQSAIMEKLKALNYDDKRAEQLAKEIYQSSISANGSRYKNVSGSNSWSFSGGGGGMSNVDYVDQQIARYAQYAGNQTVSTGAIGNTEPKTTIRIEANGRSVDVQANAGDRDVLTELLGTLGKLSKTT